MAKRIRASARYSARKPACKSAGKFVRKSVSKAARADATCDGDAPAPAKRGPKPGTPSWRKFKYAPDLIKDCRRRYEETPETNVSIARDYGIDECTVRRLADDYGWIKFDSQRIGLPPDVKLLRRVQALAADGGLRPPQQNEGEDAGGGKDDAQTHGEASAAPIASAIAEVQEQLGELTARRKCKPQTSADAQRSAHTIANLTATLRTLRVLQDRAQQGTSHDDNDDHSPADIDEFRNELARRIDAFVASRADQGGAGDAAAPPADEA